jgi:hypothetical protein
MIELNDIPFKYNKSLPGNTYHKYCKNYYSQNGEDGILEQLIKELEIKDGFCCEFGASDGITSSNTYNLITKHNFTSIQIEANADSFNKLLNTYKTYEDRVFCYNAFVNESNLKDFLSERNYPIDFDVLSIDIDSYDYDIWKNFTSYEPKIVIIEANSYRDPIVEETHGNKTTDYTEEDDPLSKWKPSRVAEGSSFIKIVELGLNKGYIPLSFTGNVIFVHKSCISKIKEFPYIISDNKYDYVDLYSNLSMWKDEWFTNTGIIFNVAIKNHYKKFGTKKIDMSWIFKEMKEMTENKEKIYITSKPRSDGFGAQYQNIIYDILYAEANNYNYVYTPIQHIEHNYNNDEKYIEQIENIMNVKNTYTKPDNNVQVDIINGRMSYNFIESDINKYINNDTMKPIRELFWQNKNKNFFNNGKTNIAVHIRRLNQHDSRTEGTDIPDEYYKTIMNSIREIYNNTNLLFHIYSQGNSENFESFKNEDVVLHLDENLSDTFTGMVAADILVTSKSSLSYVAALLNENQVFYLEFWHPQLSHWLKFTIC